MLTENYTITFFGVDARFYTVDFIAYLWEQSANIEYQRSGIFVSSTIEVNKVVCGKIRGCDLGEIAHLITVVRNPAEVSDPEIFRISLLNVLYDVKEKLDNPYMTLRTESVDFNFFETI